MADLPTWADEVAAVTAVAAALISAGTIFIQRRETERQARIAQEALLTDYYSHVRGWADLVIDGMAEAEAFCRISMAAQFKGDPPTARSALLARLSALWDRGRFFFPNEQPDAHGLDKQPAFRGFRPAVLDCLKEAHEAMLKLSPGWAFDDYVAAKDRLVRARRAFISEVHAALDPRAHQTRLRRLAGGG